MTEEEAKTKWCPMTRVGHVAGMAINRHPDEQDFYSETRCVASRCMMWRFDPLPAGIITIRIPPDPDAPKPNGYCGLAS